MYAYDAAGWFTGEGAGVPIAPPMDSTTTVPGELRARWQRFTWVIEPYAPAAVPSWVWMWQAREILIEQGLMGAVQGAIDSIADPIERAKAANRWEFDTKVNRDNALMEQLRQAIAISDDQLSAMFIAAAAKV